ncbi:MAG: hypothetical protein WBJ68_11480 [Candidatus Dechloromonas phosphoritropha]|jgi:hypothetical protein
MMDGQYTNPPESYLKIINPLIDTARGFLERGEQLAPIAFVGSFATGKMIPILLNSAGEEEKDRSALAIRIAADTLEADFVFVIMDAWSLRKDKMAQMEAILDKYGSIGASPYRVDVVSFALETRYGVWMAQCEIKPKGISKKKRTIDPPKFQYFTEVGGRFSHFLKERPNDEGKATLH